MITVISGTARPDSYTLRLADFYRRLLNDKGQETHLLSLEELPVWDRNPQLLHTEQQLLIPAERFVFVMPEYNGSFPGRLKTLIDNSDIRKCWWGKKALLTGLADGRAGNFRGLEHMTGILQYLHVHVFWNKLPLSRISDELDTEGRLLKPATEAAIYAQI
ncbi:MAG: NAD(P)H-dependent oxidoreductase, partial [Bacteroidetes bacterium]|nr:NAD(P)H-dependent oxidoreductase [Bacteroidota bacterium]